MLSGTRDRPYGGAVPVELVEITDENRPSVVALELGPGQERFVSTVAGSLAEAAAVPQGRPWYRAVHVDGELVGFVMISWDLRPVPEGLNGPWFLWKLLVDRRHQGRGHGRAIVETVVDLVRAEGGEELLTSHVVGEGGPAGFYEKLGFVPRGDLDADGEVLLRLDLRSR